MFGFLYVREHPSYENACKVGITDNIPDRESTYATGELRRGKFSIVFKIELDSESDLKKIDKDVLKIAGASPELNLLEVEKPKLEE
jgi:hypothetical protein